MSLTVKIKLMKTYGCNFEMNVKIINKINSETFRLGLMSILYLIMSNVVTLGGRHFSFVTFQISAIRMGVRGKVL
jgi:hypothetical protein